jgi:predicted DNA-binding protein
MVYVTYTMRRTQIYLDEDQTVRLRAAAKAGRRTVSEIIREAVEEKLSSLDGPPAFERALAEVQGIWAERRDLEPTDDYIRKIRRDRRSAAAG